MSATTAPIHINVKRVAQSRLSEVDFDNIPFGRVFSDHLFSVQYQNGEWQNAEIIPYEALRMSPALMALHYGQSIFEGMKAYYADGDILLFRPLENWKRLNASAERMCMQPIPKEVFMDGLMKLIEIDREWVPKKEGNSLYIRPIMYATDEYIGVRPSDTYRFLIMTCPVGAYYSEPVKVKVESFYTRAAEGGVGFAKAAGNYAASLYPALQAQKQGYQQLLWTDAKEHKYIEESGTMNVMFVVNDVLLTPKLTGSILPGITRNSVLRLARDWKMNVEERRISVAEIINAIQKGELQEAFGVGTAATITHIKTIHYDGIDYELPDVKTRQVSNRLAETLNGIRTGKIPDEYEWNLRLSEYVGY
jgi:branched-chain amino acid aminotransferase